MIVIFIASTGVGSSRNTGRIIGPLLRWFKPDVSPETISAVQAVVRKSGHLTEYAVLALLWWRARRLSRGVGGWSWREFWIVVAFCAGYACTDEFHQYFVASRQGSPLDVLIDSVGAIAGLLLIWSIGRRRHAW